MTPSADDPTVSTGGPTGGSGASPPPPGHGTMLSRASREDRGAALVGVGGLLLFVSLFLNWYEPGRSAWTVFEVWDLVLAVLAVVAVVGSAGRLGMVVRRPDSWLTGPAVASFLIVLVALINHPPAATGAAPMFGLWLALFASIVMLVGVTLSVAGVSVAINLHSHGHHGATGVDSASSGTPPASAADPTTSGHERGRWFRHHGREQPRTGSAAEAGPPSSGSSSPTSPSPTSSSPAPARVPTPPAPDNPPRRRRPARGTEAPTQVTEPQEGPDPRGPSS